MHDCVYDRGAAGGWEKCPAGARNVAADDFDTAQHCFRS